MMNFLTRAGLSAVLLAVGGGACAAAGPPADADRNRLERLDGTWASPASEAWYGAYGRRTFTFDDGRWSLVFDFGFDPALEQKVFTFRTEGAYRVGERSEDTPNAFRTVFFEEAKYVTFHPDDPELMAQFGMADCGLTPGVEADISERGCANWKPVSVCGEDHDLFAIDAQERLYFGVRPADNDMCSADKTPTALLGPVVRQ